MEPVGTDVDDPASQVHEPEVDDTVRVVWYGPGGRSAVVAEYVVRAGEDPVAVLVYRYSET